MKKIPVCLHESQLFLMLLLQLVILPPLPALILTVRPQVLVDPGSSREGRSGSLLPQPYFRVRSFVHMYIYIIYIYIYIYIYYTYIYIYIYIYKYIHITYCIPMWCTCTNARIHTASFILTHIHTCMHACMHTYCENVHKSIWSEPTVGLIVIVASQVASVVRITPLRDTNL